ncbi:MAG: hypothetical protein ACHQAV_03980 [Solirubrobacterales bacterium]
MRLHVRFSLLALLVGAIVAISAPAAQAAFGVERFFAANCNAFSKGECKNAATPEEEKKNAEKEGYTQAAGHPDFGITDFKINTTGTFPAEVPSGVVKHVRTDVAPGVSTNPEAVPKCSFAEFGAEALPKSGLFPETKCKAETEIGINEVLVFAGAGGDVPLSGAVYNLVQPKGLASDFGVALKLPKPLTEAELFEIFKGSQPGIETAQYYAHTLIEGNVEWGEQPQGTGRADYHDYFEINISTALPLISSRLSFKGNIGTLGKGGFLSNPTSCTGVGPQTTTGLTLTPKEGSPVRASYTTPIGTEGCNGLAPFSPVPFAPTFSLGAETTQSDQPDGITTEVGLPHAPEPTQIDTSQLNTASITLPEGLTLNESAARVVTEACTPAQARIHSATPGVGCPAGSKVGTITLNVPGLPPGSLEGGIYLGGPESGPITAPPYTVYLDAESERYGISVRIKGSVVPNTTTGRLTANFTENPEQPFSTAILHFNGGPLASLANPLACGTATAESVFTPFTGTAAQSPASGFAVDSNNAGGACASPLPFSLAQSTENQTANAGGHTNFTFNLTRPGGNQYISAVKTTLPAGLDGAIPAATQCGEPQASEGTCPSSSVIGKATVEAGSGPAPFTFSGPVYLTGPYNGAPFGMSIAVPAVAGPFNLGTVVTRATINVDPRTSRVTVEANLPRIAKGVGLASSGVLVRLTKISMAINRQGFLFNPTNCSALATESTLTGYTLPQNAATGTQSVSTPFQVGECNKLAFKPSFKATAGGRTSKANGASLEATINQAAGQANIKSVLVQLPKQLPSRLTTLQKACPEATFAANPFICPKGSFVGGARANTPLLPGKLTGPAILVSHAAAAFPDLDLVLEANGVRTILTGNTDIKKGITTTNFASTPDVPVTSVTVNLPVGPHSALAANGDLCTSTLVMPTTIEGWSGGKVKQNTKIGTTGCGVRIVGHKVIGNTAFLTVQTFAAGRISGSGVSLATVYRHLRSAARATTLKVPLSGAGRRRGKPFSTRVRVGFVPSRRGEATSTAFVTVRF